MGVSRFLSLVAVMGVTAAPAFAGFEFNPPPRVAAPAPQQSAQPSPTAAMTMDAGGPLTPMPIEPVAESDIMGAPPLPPIPAAPATQAQSNDTRVNGFGKDVPLNLALSQIVPSAYRVDFAPSVDQNILVSWNGNNRPWADVVDQILRTKNLTVGLNENVITIKTIDAPAVMAGRSGASWQAAAGTTLRETLTAWAQKNNVYLEWQSPYDYPVTNAFSFDGSFERAVESLLTLYQADKNPPKGKLYPNQPNGPVVLVIK